MEYTFHNHSHQDKQHSAGFTGKKAFFAIALVVSLATNFYFLLWGKHESPAPAVAEANVAHEAKVTAPPASVQEESEAKPSEAQPAVKPDVSAVPASAGQSAGAQNRFQVQKVSFAPEKTHSGREIVSLQFKVEGSLSYSLCQIMAAGDCDIMSAYISRNLAWVVDLKRHMLKGDSISLIYEMRPDTQEKFKILKLVYKSLTLNKTFEMNYYKSPEAKYGKYYDPDGTEIAKSIEHVESPIKDYEEITSLPGEFRQNKVRGHSGTDFKAEAGTPVYATFPGEVKRVNWNFRANGDCVEIDHPQLGIRTIYLHLSKVDVKPGTHIERGQKLGESGNTGRSFAPHLHYEIQSLDAKKTIYNPFSFKYHKTYNNKLPSAALDEYKKTVHLYNTFLNNVS